MYGQSIRLLEVFILILKMITLARALDAHALPKESSIGDQHQDISFDGR
jgi:hypothetical protein